MFLGADWHNQLVCKLSFTCFKVKLVVVGSIWWCIWLYICCFSSWLNELNELSAISSLAARLWASKLFLFLPPLFSILFCFFLLLPLFQQVAEMDNAIMPQLQSLDLQSCGKLKALPHYLLGLTSLKELSVDWCPVLAEYCQKEWPNISRIPNIRLDGVYVQRSSHWTSSQDSGYNIFQLLNWWQLVIWSTDVDELEWRRLYPKQHY